MKKVMSPEDRAAALAALALISDDQIDTVDIPETSEENWATARRGGGRPTVKMSVTLSLSPQVIGWFKAQGRDGDFETAMSQVLADHVAHETAQAPRAPAVAPSPVGTPT